MVEIRAEVTAEVRRLRASRENRYTRNSGAVQVILPCFATYPRNLVSEICHVVR